MLVFGVASFSIAYRLVPPHRLKKVYITALLAALALRFAITCYIYRTGTDTFGTDGLLYHLAGIDIFNSLRNGQSIFGLEYPYTWYTEFTGIIYFIFGINRYLASFINAFMAVLSGLMLFRISVRIGYGFLNAAIISSAFLYFPNLLLWTSDTRKESLLIFLCLITWYTIQNIIVYSNDRLKLFPVITTIVSVCLLMWLCTLVRIYMFIPLFIGIVTSQLIQYKKNKSSVCLLMSAAAIITVAIIVIATVYPQIQNHHAMALPGGTTDSIIGNLAKKAAFITNSVTGRNIPEALVECLLIPYPGKVNISDIQGMNAVKLLVDLDMLAWYICLLMAPAGLYRAIRDKQSSILGVLAFSAVYILLNAALVQFEQGAVYRYRSVIVAFILLFLDGQAIKSLFMKFDRVAGKATAGGYQLRQ